MGGKERSEIMVSKSVHVSFFPELSWAEKSVSKFKRIHDVVVVTIIVVIIVVVIATLVVVDTVLVIIILHDAVVVL